MKRIILLTVCLSMIAISSYSQDPCDAFAGGEMYWYGYDFSKAKFIGTDFDNAENIVSNFFPAWNNLVLNETTKYDIKKFYKKSSVQYKLDNVTARNAKVNSKKLVSVNSSDEVNLTVDDVSAEIKTYNVEKDTGVGLVFFIENFNKFQQTAKVSVVFFDISSKSVLFVKKISGKAAGVGLRNYWAGAMYNIMKECYAKYGSWKSEYCKKK